MNKMWKVAILGVMLSVFTAVTSWGQTTSGTVQTATQTQGSMTRHVIDWTSDAGGNVVFAGPGPIGYLRQVEFMPAAGTDAPTTWTVIIKNDMGRDILEGGGASRSASATTTIFPILNTPSTSSTNQVYGAIFGRINVAITSAGNAKKGRIALYVDRYN